MVEELSHVKQLYLNRLRKIGLTKPCKKNANFYHVKTIFCFLFIRDCSSGRTGDDWIHSIHCPHVHSRRGKSNKPICTRITSQQPTLSLSIQWWGQNLAKIGGSRNSALAYSFLILMPCESTVERLFTVRGQSYLSRLPKYWPPIPLSAWRVCPPPQQRRGVNNRRAERGMEGQHFGRRQR